MDRIGRYEILDELGRGAMGIVYRARDPSIGRLIAIKTIRLADFADPIEAERLRERLRREAHSAGILSHPGIVIVYDVGQQGELAYIAMEFIQGRSLENLLDDRQSLDQQTILNILRQAAAALDHAHAKGIVHRDIKPANILISDDSTVKITDFGVAKIASSAQLTQAGTVLGTPNYMSPEQIQGKEVDGRADQFALGVVAYEVLTGDKPFVGEQLTTVLYKIVAEQPAPPQDINPSVGWPVSIVLNKALAKTAAERYATCTEFVTALEGALKSKKDWKPVPRGASDSLPTAAVSTTVRDHVAARIDEVAERTQAAAARRKKRSLAWPVLLTAMGAFAIGAGIFFVVERWTAPSPPVVQEPPKPAPGGSRPAPMPPAVQPDQPAPSEPGGVTSPAQTPPGGAETKPETPVEKPKPEPPPEPEPEPPKVERRPVTQRPPPEPPPAPGPFTLQVTTNPPGAEVMVDESPAPACSSPCSVPLPPGRHTLLARLAGHRDERRIVTLKAPQEVFIDLRRQTGTVRIESTPPGAQISVNGQSRSELTPATLTLPIGRYDVTVTKDGHGSQQTIELKDGAYMRVYFPLAQ